MNLALFEQENNTAINEHNGLFEQTNESCMNINKRKLKSETSVDDKTGNTHDYFSVVGENCSSDSQGLFKNTNSATFIQGSFHQAHPMFGDNAGTQCVTNCLAGLAFAQVKESYRWSTEDMNNILYTGDELYTFLQRSSSMHSRYLLVDELPQYFDCFRRSFEFTIQVTLASSICMANEEPCYADFDAYPLYEALQMALLESDGCFV